jgi:sporulation protein YlmC with PRC-barrel domain
MDEFGKALIRQTVDIRDIVGKRVLAANGSEVGIVRSIRLDPTTLDTDIFVLDTGHEHELLIGRNYISRIGEGVELSMVPWETMVGKEVYDTRGLLIGRVKDIKRIGTTSKVESMVVAQPNKDIHIDGKYLEHVSDHIGLNIAVEA